MASPGRPTTTIAASIHKIQLFLIDPSAAVTDRHLLAASALLSQPDYEDVVVERSIADLCGYPLCPNALPHGRPQSGAARFRVALSEHKVYDQQENCKYCSPDCLIGSRAYSAALSTERHSELSSSAIEQVLGLFGCGEDLGKGGDLGFSKLTIQEKIDDKVSAGEWVSGPSDAIDGYVPRYDRKQGTKRAESRASNEVDFISTIIGDEFNNGAPIESSFGVEDVSEMIAKQLEDVVIAEKEARSKRPSSKPSTSKPMERVKGNMIDKVDFKSTIVLEDHSNGVSASASLVPVQNSSKQLGKGLEDGLHIGKKKSSKKAIDIDASRKMEPKGNARKESQNLLYQTKKVPEETVLKSSLKSSRSKSGNQSVSWADGKQSGALEEGGDSLKATENSQLPRDEDDNSLWFASAEACAAALVQAAEAVASGESESGDAVTDAGILILPQPQYVNDVGSDVNEDMLEIEQGFAKWPKKPVLLDTDVFDVEDSWHDTPPEGFGLSLSPFATMWMALFGWISCSSLAYIYGCNDSAQDDFLFVNGREYPRKIVLRDGKSSEIMQTLDGCVCRALPGLVMSLRLPIPVSTLEKALGCLLDTMTFVDALPSFKMKQWQAIVLLFIDALSVHRIPVLAPHMTHRDMLTHMVLNAAQISGEEYEAMRDLIMPLGRLPHFSMQSGG